MGLNGPGRVKAPEHTGTAVAEARIAMAQPYLEPCDRGVIEAQPCPRKLGREIEPKRRRWILVACILASSMAFIDGSALTVALPNLRDDFGVDFASVQWVVNGYVLALASFTLIGGALADVYGKARMLTIGCVGFGIASIACAIAPSPFILVIARIVQGVMAAIVTPSSLALIGATFPETERNRAIGIWAAASALTTAGGPILGGWLTQTFGWQAVFWINPPLATAAVATLVAFAAKDRLEERQFDVTGAIILAFALATLAWLFSDIGPGESDSVGDNFVTSGVTTALVGVVGFASLIAYAVWERTTAHPMTPPRLFANRPFTGLNAATLLIYGALSIMFFLLPFELVDRRGLSPIEAGLVFLPFTLGLGLLSQLFGSLADKVGSRTPLIAGSIGASIAYALMAGLRDAPLWLGTIAPMAVLGVAFALLVAPLTGAVMSSVGKKDEGLASGMNNAASRIAQLVGVSIAAGMLSYETGYAIGLTIAAVTSAGGAFVVAFTVPSLSKYTLG